MLDKEYKVRYITSKNSFLFLSDKDYHYSNSQDVLIRLNYGLNKTAYFSLGPPLPSLKEGELALSSLYAKELAIVKNDTVTLSSTTRISSVRRLTIVPSSNDDYEILELLSDTVQSILLGQVRIVHNGQKLIIWISNSIHVTVMVDGIIPISPGKLENMTEVSIMPADTQIATKDNVQKQPETKNSSHKTPTLVNLFSSFISAVFRVHPTEILALKEDCLFKQPFNVFLNQKDLPAWFQEIESTKDTIILGKLHVITPPLDLQDSEVNEDRKDVFVRILNLEEFGIGNDSNVIFVNSALRDILRISTGSRVILEKFKDVIGLGSTGRIKIKTSRKIFSTAVDIVRNYLLYHCKNEVFVVNSNVQLSDHSGNKFLLSFEPDTPYCLADKLFISVRRNLFIIDDNEIVFNAEDDKKIEKELELCLDSSNFSKIFEDIEKCVDLKFSYLVKDSVNVLIVGKPGSGKSSLASYITQKLSMSRHQVHPEFVNCKKLKGKNVDSLLKILNAKFARLIYFQPSILILDDLHVICEKVIEGEAPTQENLHFNKISEILANFLEDCLQKNCIAILATSESIHKLNQNIYSSRGRQIFKNVFSIDDLTKSDRIKLMKYFFNLKNIEYKNVDENILGVETEGFVMQDLIDCIDKIMFESFKENPTQKLIKISSKHCENAIKQSSSLSMREVQLHSPGDRDFDDVGGMGDVKKILIECMLWPLQYPQIFDKSPLRLQSGLLLYGPPGTGKTIIAAAAAKHCNLRLISIKGPELLSKYIGASEQAVRDVFLKAQTAKPCILFFDEFDSLAPRRGHDNTGVTDRVVNQFLTQLDGVESLSGVCVLAATSRPDLLDPALLRPGRLDRQILCPLPDKDSRLEILKALSKKINLTEDINLSKLAVESVGFSGADLQAVLCTAQLNSVEHLLDNDKEEFSSTDKIVITQKHLDDALKSTKPSLTREEKLKYERIYSKFQSKGDQLDLLQGKQKSTLA